MKENAILVFWLAFGTLLPLAHAQETITVRVLNDTGRTAMARSVKADGATIVANGCLRWVPSGSICQIAMRKGASTASVLVDFDGVQKVVSF